MDTKNKSHLYFWPVPVRGQSMPSVLNPPRMTSGGYNYSRSEGRGAEEVIRVHVGEGGVLERKTLGYKAMPECRKQKGGTHEIHERVHP
jgi:hypothetical protein